jgi:hypothetical protein
MSKLGAMAKTAKREEPATPPHVPLDMVIGLRQRGGGVQVVEIDPRTGAVLKTHQEDMLEMAMDRIDGLVLARYAR